MNLGVQSPAWLGAAATTPSLRATHQGHPAGSSSRCEQDLVVGGGEYLCVLIHGKFSVG